MRSYIFILFFIIISHAMPVSAGERVTYHVGDQLNSSALLISSSGQLIGHEHLDSFGSVLSGGNDSSRFSVSYHGKIRDNANGLINFGARIYDPNAARFLAIDPRGYYEDQPSSFNRYAFANNNPYGYTDKNGRYLEAPLEVVSVSVGVASLTYNVNNGNWASAALDLAGLGIDGLMSVIPAAPGVASLAIQAHRQSSNAAEVAADATSQVISKAEQLRINRAAGLAAEAQAKLDLIADGYTILGSQVTVRTSEGRRVIDHLVEAPDGTRYAIEVKAGNARRSSSQVKKDQAMAEEGALVIGKNARDDVRGEVIVVETKEMRYD